jgi:hypothetical protein
VLFAQHRRWFSLGRDLNDEVAHGGIRAFYLSQVLRADVDELGELDVRELFDLRVAALNRDAKVRALQLGTSLQFHRQAGYSRRRD